MKHSESIKEIGGAVAKAQGAIKNAAADKTNPAFRSKYADLASVWEACRAQLSANGVAVVQSPAAEGAKVTVTTLLVHGPSGEWIESDLTVTADKGTPQGIGSAITYARRYGLSAMVGVAPGDDIPDQGDDDGEAAEGRQQPPKTRAESVKAKVAEKTALHKNPAFRKQEAIREIGAMGLDVRATFKDAVGRTFPDGQDIKLLNEEELERVERHVVLLKAKHNEERGQAAH